MDDEKKNIHEGHRQRMKKYFVDHGFNGLEDHQILELILFYAFPRRDTNTMAHRLLDRYGNLAKVCDTPIDILEKDFGLSQSTAVLLKMIPEMARVYSESKHKSESIDIDSAPDIMRSKFIGANFEKVALALSTANNRLIMCDIVCEGSISATEMPIRKIVDLALRHNAKFAYVAHNHPSGLCLPSRPDLETTRKLSETLNSIGVILVDHIIFTDTDCFSVHTNNKFKKYFVNNHGV